MELNLHLKRDHKPAEYLSCVKDRKLQKLTKYRLLITGYRERMAQRRRQPREQTSLLERAGNRNVSYCTDYYHYIRAADFPKCYGITKCRKIKSRFRWKFQNDHNSSKIYKTQPVDKTETQFLACCTKTYFIFRQCFNIFLVCGEKKNYCTCFTDLFLSYVLHNLFIHVMDNALAILCKSCQ